MSDLLPVYGLCVVMLFCKMLALSCYQGWFRLRGLAFTNPEDAAVFKRAPQSVERPQVLRAAKAWANDLENIPLFFALGGLAVALGTPAGGSAWLMVVFTLARGLHTLAYLAGVQPWRTLFYWVGILCLAGLAVLCCVAITSASPPA